MSPVPIEDLFSQMRAERVESPNSVERERERTRLVARMKSLHVTLVHERARRFNPRKNGGLLLVAAMVAFAGTALAGAAGYGPTAAWLATRPKVGPASTAREPALRAPTARTVAAPPVPRDTAAPPSAVTASVSPPVARVRAERPADSRAPKAPADKVRELELVNRLFADAKRARREHRDADALALLNELLVGYPRSQLAHEASVERFRTLSRLGRAAEARRRAEGYLAAYPKGFAVEEARALLEPRTP